MSYKLKVNNSNDSQKKISYNYQKAGVLIYSIKDNEKYVLLGRHKNKTLWSGIEINKSSQDGSNSLLTASRGFVIGTNNYGYGWTHDVKKYYLGKAELSRPSPIYHHLSLNPPIGIVTPGIVISRPLGLNLANRPTPWSNFKDSTTYSWIYSGLKNTSKLVSTNIDGIDIVYYQYMKYYYDDDLPNRFFNNSFGLSARMSDYIKLKWVKESDLLSLDCNKVNRLLILDNEVVSNQLCKILKLFTENN